MRFYYGHQSFIATRGNVSLQRPCAHERNFRAFSKSLLSTFHRFDSLATRSKEKYSRNVKLTSTSIVN